MCLDEWQKLITAESEARIVSSPGFKFRMPSSHWHGAKCRAFYSIASSLWERDVFVANEGVNLIASVILRVHNAVTPQRVHVTRGYCAGGCQRSSLIEDPANPETLISISRLGASGAVCSLCSDAEFSIDLFLSFLSFFFPCEFPAKILMDFSCSIIIPLDWSLNIYAKFKGSGIEALLTLLKIWE